MLIIMMQMNRLKHVIVMCVNYFTREGTSNIHMEQSDIIKKMASLNAEVKLFFLNFNKKSYTHFSSIVQENLFKLNLMGVLPFSAMIMTLALSIRISKAIF
jgi:hypothetical protein